MIPSNLSLILVSIFSTCQYFFLSNKLNLLTLPVLNNYTETHTNKQQQQQQKQKQKHAPSTYKIKA